jgi:hypothetical protein
MELEAAGWSGDGAFTQVLIDALKELPGIRFLKVEDAPASRADASFSFISNELFVAFAAGRAALTLARLQEFFETVDGIGAPDYADDGMLQYLRTERIVQPYQTRGYKLIELVRIYEAGSPPRRDP